MYCVSVVLEDGREFGNETIRKTSEECAEIAARVAASFQRNGMPVLEFGSKKVG